MKTGPQDFDYDVAIVGGGSAGYAAARTSVAAGLRAIVIEGGEQVGGLCILRGCMPTKTLLYAAEVRHLSSSGGLWGLQPGPIGFDWQAVQARKDRLIEEFAAYRREQLNGGQFSFRRAWAKFSDPHTLELSDGTTLTTAHAILTTGSIVAPSPLPELTEAGYLTSDDALALRELPKSLIVLGGGAVGVELAQILARFDVKITLIQRSAHLLKEFDSDAAQVVEAVLHHEGISLFTSTHLLDAHRDGSGKTVTFLHEGRKRQVHADDILFGLGRTAASAGLGLEDAGVETDQGRILTDAAMRTSAPHIYAAGDCTGPHELVHLAVQQGEIAAHNIAHPDRPRTMDYRLLLNVVFTEPQLATCGLTEREAQRRGMPYLVASHPFADHGKSLLMEARHGFVKLLAAPEDGEILGAGAVGPQCGELIHELVPAMAKRMTVAEFAALPHYHPTLAEIWTYPAEELAVRIQS